jgi:poly(beta-D-mannuronate) lyase
MRRCTLLPLWWPLTPLTFRRTALVPLLGLGLLTLEAQLAQAELKCPRVPKPMTSLEIGSRYEKGDASRSEIDEDGNAAVNKALRPLDLFVRAVAALTKGSSSKHADDEKHLCLYSALASWADAGALSDLSTVNAKLAISPRLAGIAIAYNEAKEKTAPPPEKRRTIEAWLGPLGHTLQSFFDNDAPEMASQNNLRAWAALAVTQIGLATNDDALISWGSKSTEMVVCSADDDGALPFEMKRGDKALHYQLHAVAPLVVNTVLLDNRTGDGFQACGAKLERIVDFTLSALENPQLAAAKAGTEQSFSTGSETLEPFQLAWLEPYLKRQKDEKALRFAEKYRPLSNSNLGGNLTDQYSSN